MTVAELIAELQKMDPSLPVKVNDEIRGQWHETIDFVYDDPGDPEYEDEPCVVLVVNECV